MRFFFSNGTSRRAPSSGCCREVATIRSAVLGRIFEITFFDVRFEAIFLKGRPIGIKRQLEILLAWHALRGHVTAFLMSGSEIILYYTMEWRKRLVNKKRGSLPAHGFRSVNKTVIRPVTIPASERFVGIRRKRFWVDLIAFRNPA